MSLEDTYRAAVASVLAADAAIARCKFDIQVTWTEWQEPRDCRYVEWARALRSRYPGITRYRHAETMAGFAGSIFLQNGSYGVAWQRPGMPCHWGMRTIRMAETCFMAGLDRGDVRQMLIVHQGRCVRNVEQVEWVYGAFAKLRDDTQRKVDAVMRKVRP